MPDKSRNESSQEKANSPAKKAAKRAPKRASKRATKSTQPRENAEPVLLSGGNPQIPKGDGDGPVQAYLAAMPGWKKEVGKQLDALIVKTVPAVRKAVRWNSPFYGIEGRGWFLSYHCFSKYIKVVFLRGASLKPVPPVASKHPETRYYHIVEHERLDEKLLSNWIAQAAKLPGDELF